MKQVVIFIVIWLGIVISLRAGTECFYINNKKAFDFQKSGWVTLTIEECNTRSKVWERVREDTGEYLYYIKSRGWEVAPLPR